MTTRAEEPQDGPERPLRDHEREPAERLEPNIWVRDAGPTGPRPADDHNPAGR